MPSTCLASSSASPYLMRVCSKICTYGGSQEQSARQLQGSELLRWDAAPSFEKAFLRGILHGTMASGFSGNLAFEQ